MRKVVCAMTVSVDGYIEAADGGIEWTAPGDELHEYFNDRESQFDAHLYGRRLYEIMSGAWPAIYEDPNAAPVMKRYAEIWMAKPKVVFSTTLEKVDFGSRLVREDVAGEVAKLKSQPGNYLSAGGPGLIASLMRFGLVDEFWLYISPIILGGGKRLFPKLKSAMPLELMETRRFDAGLTLMRYRTKGNT